MPFKKTAQDWFVAGRGNVSGELAKSNEDVIHEEAEIVDDETFPSQNGHAANEEGAKPIYATGSELPFHYGRGLGRGHGSETK